MFYVWCVKQGRTATRSCIWRHDAPRRRPGVGIEVRRPRGRANICGKGVVQGQRVDDGRGGRKSGARRRVPLIGTRARRPAIGRPLGRGELVHIGFRMGATRSTEIGSPTMRGAPRTALPEGHGPLRRRAVTIKAPRRGGRRSSGAGIAARRGGPATGPRFGRAIGPLSSRPTLVTPRPARAHGTGP